MRTISELGYLFHLLTPTTFYVADGEVEDGYEVAGKYETYEEALANVTSENQVIRLLDVLPN